MTRSILTSSVAACICLGLSVPLLAAEPTVTAQAAPSSSAPALATTNSNEKLRAAAEPFEKLAETSFKATLPAIDQTIGEAEAAARGGSRIALDRCSQSIGRADRGYETLSFIEAYRVLVSAVADYARVPTEVSLLDYAGFRYDADLKASPIRWSDMAEAVSFARENWAKLLPRAKSSTVSTAFEKSITDMAVAQSNKSYAASSVKAELDLVDQLEKFFSAH